MSTLIMKLGPSFTAEARAAAMASSPSARSAFQRDARHFLKQVANRLKLRGSEYTISTRASGTADAAEVVLRSGALLLIVSMHRTGARVSFASHEAGVTVRPEELRHVPLDRLTAPALQRAFLAWCQRILRPSQVADVAAPAAAAPPATDDG
jgi:hypothetical protein